MSRERRFPNRPSARAFVATLAASLGLAACNGCRTQASTAAPATPTPTLRVWVVSNLAGALEPCGCTKNQLGGIDHVAALFARERAAAPTSIAVAAGPTFFQEPSLDGARAAQDGWKAEAIASSLASLGVVALAPGYNDFAAGTAALASLAAASKASVVAANLAGPDLGFVASTSVRDAGGVKVGFVGVSSPKREGAPPKGVEIAEAMAALERGIGAVRAGGAQIVIGLAALPRGEALRLADRVSGLSLLVLGKPVDAGEANDAPAPPVLAGSTLVVETSNHLQTVGAVDFFVRDGSYAFADGSGVAAAEKALSLAKRARDLEGRLTTWENDPSVPRADVEARRADLERLRAEKARAETPPAPPSGSYFRFALREVRAELGTEGAVRERIATYYKLVNEHNARALAGKKPVPAAPGAPSYVGLEVCSSCHEAERKVWDRTPHARAYATLERDFKNFNLDCVSCHVTGYERPGGSTVTENAKLRGVQCEVCHGPGSAHVDEPTKKGVLKIPTPETCTGECHHPPHVEGFDAATKQVRVLGPGHGLPDDAPWPAWATEDAGAR